MNAGRMIRGKLPIWLAIRDASSLERGNSGPGDIEPDSEHRFFEKLTIFSFCYRLGVGANQANVVPDECTVAIQFHGRVECGLASHRGQDRVRLLAFEDRFDHFRRNRLDVSAVGETPGRS